MIHVVVMKCLIGLPLFIHVELLSFYEGVGVRSFKNRGVGVGAFVHRLHSPAYYTKNFKVNAVTL
jgi:hypothetical protein